MAILAALVIAPQIGLAAYALGSQEFRASLGSHPVAALEFAAVLAFWIGLVCWPLHSLLVALGTTRTVELGNGEVKVIDQAPFSTRTSRTPLASFEGIAINALPSFSRPRHEAVLVHQTGALSVVLMAAEHIGEPEIRELCRVLGLPRLPERRPHGHGGPWRGRAATAAATAVAA